MVRDTDADWRAIGATFPYWGVLTAPQYRRSEIAEADLAAFYASGRTHIGEVAERLARISGAPLRVGRALDFGCGAGRLAEAMADYADATTGLDVSPGMLAEARRNGAGRTTYVDVLPDGPFDWINSFIVFQHIPPERGEALLEQLLERLAPGGLVSLHFTFHREPHLVPPAPPTGWRARLRPQAPSEPVGALMMFDYDAGRVLAMLARYGVAETALVHTDHGGHHGAMIFGRRS